jgi:DNA-binding XRE family transcriptional regulator
MGTPGVPNYYGRQLLRNIRTLREQCGMTQDEAGQKLHLTLQKLSRIENGQLPGYHELRAMLQLYGLQAGQWPPYFQLWDRARARGWWRKFGVRDTTYICMEQEASTMAEFSLGRLPELLQTEGYARRAVQGMFPGNDKAVDNHVAVRLRRQSRLFHEENPLTLHTLVHEPTLYQGVDRAQLAELHKRAQLPTVTLQIIPQRVGLHPGLDGSVVLLEFDDPQEPRIAFTESVLGVTYSQNEDKTAAVRRRLGHLAKLALSPESSLSALRRLIG